MTIIFQCCAIGNTGELLPMMVEHKLPPSVACDRWGFAIEEYLFCRLSFRVIRGLVGQLEIMMVQIRAVSSVDLLGLTYSRNTFNLWLSDLH